MTPKECWLAEALRGEVKKFKLCEAICSVEQLRELLNKSPRNMLGCGAILGGSGLVVVQRRTSSWGSFDWCCCYCWVVKLFTSQLKGNKDSGLWFKNKETMSSMLSLCMLSEPLGHYVATAMKILISLSLPHILTCRPATSGFNFLLNKESTATLATHIKPSMAW